MDFKGNKNPQHALLKRGIKAEGPMSYDCTAYKKSLGKHEQKNTSQGQFIHFHASAGRIVREL
jgi:hypothetical protein